jgi:hypothetical protein
MRQRLRELPKLPGALQTQGWRSSMELSQGYLGNVGGDGDDNLRCWTTEGS